MDGSGIDALDNVVDGNSSFNWAALSVSSNGGLVSGNTVTNNTATNIGGARKALPVFVGSSPALAS